MVDLWAEQKVATMAGASVEQLVEQKVDLKGTRTVLWTAELMVCLKVEW